MHIYGLTETYGPMTTSGVHPEWEDLEMEERARLMARQGQGYCTADLVRVVDENMHDVERDGETMGEIVMHGNMVAKGYFENEEATEEAFEGGWYHSGDVAVWHPDGYIEIRDREQGHHHLRRREHLDHRGGAGRLAPSGRHGGRRRRHPRREVGRAPQGLRRPQEGPGGDRSRRS